MDSNKKRR